MVTLLLISRICSRRDQLLNVDAKINQLTTLPANTTFVVNSAFQQVVYTSQDPEMVLNT